MKEEGSANRVCDMHTAMLSASICRGQAGGEERAESEWMVTQKATTHVHTHRHTHRHTHTRIHTHTYTHRHTHTHARAHTHTNLVGACIVYNVLQEEQHCLQGKTVLAGQHDEECLHGLQPHGAGDNCGEREKEEREGGRGEGKVGGEKRDEGGVEGEREVRKGMKG